MSADPRPYRLLFWCELEQQTALSVGGTDEPDSTSDMPLCRDGLQRVVLRGRSVAGALLATVRTLTNQQPAELAPTDGKPSAWSVWTGYLKNGEALPELRQFSPHRQDTRATAEHGLFDLEVLPPGGCWQVLVEFYPERCENWEDAAYLTGLALQEWSFERAWFGRRVSRGLGWMKLTKCDVLELPACVQAVDGWPDASQASLSAHHEAANTLIASLLESNEPASTTALSAWMSNPERTKAETFPQRCYRRWTGILRAGSYHPTPTSPDKSKRTYGLDAVSIGGHGSFLTDPESLTGHLVSITDETPAAFAERFAPDMWIALQQRNGKLEPYIPGSSLAGALRSTWSRQERSRNESIFDLVAQDWYAAPKEASAIGEPDSVARVMGWLLRNDGETRPQGDNEETRPRWDPVTGSSCLLIKDALLQGDKWTAMLGEKVALDEFSQAPYAKFNRMAISQGAFEFALVLEWPTSDPEGFASACAHVRALIEQLKRRQIGIGGGEFRAYGYLGLDDMKVEAADAGSPWTLIEGRAK